jgi:ParB-like chromosome segregation protein Spo0J
MAVKRILQFASPSELLDHPFSVAIYGDEALDPAFVESIGKFGIEQPIVVAADGKTIVAGHRRRKAAMLADLKEVPIIVRKDLIDDLEIKRAIVEANRHRIKTPEQIGREAMAIWKIEAELAARRRNKALKRGATKVSPKSDERAVPEYLPAAAGRSDDKAAARLGIGRDTIRKAVFVADAIDKARDRGDHARVDAIRKHTTVNAAYREAQRESFTRSRQGMGSGIAMQVAERAKEQSNGTRPFQEALTLMTKLARELERLSKLSAGAADTDKHYKSCNAAWDKLVSEIMSWENSSKRHR